ncbi:hypothetical protein IAR55_005525 [Kwoniella newhampshirensis]|uniref:F-box domain-containing protein n=1 Tax=Kwoniella newhampshirensis TaxID=1651941 RepID=A0AAW0YW13_9TREE
MRSPFSISTSRIRSESKSPRSSPSNSNIPGGQIDTLWPLPYEITCVILDHLTGIRPTLVAQLSFKYCSLAVPYIYANVTISRRNASQVFAGMCVDETGELPYPYGGMIFDGRKAKCFTHTRTLRFDDIWSAEALVMAARVFPNQRVGYLGEDQKGDPLFPGLEELIFGASLIDALIHAPGGINEAEHARWTAKHATPSQPMPVDGGWNDDPVHGNYLVLYEEFEDLIKKLAITKRLCLECPVDRSVQSPIEAGWLNRVFEKMEVPITVR